MLGDFVGVECVFCMIEGFVCKLFDVCLISCVIDDSVICGMFCFGGFEVVDEGFCEVKGGIVVVVEVFCDYLVDGVIFICIKISYVV